jgi:hypothetical protein
LTTKPSDDGSGKGKFPAHVCGEVVGLCGTQPKCNRLSVDGAIDWVLSRSEGPSELGPTVPKIRNS